MHAVANADFFDDPRWRIIASGFDTDRWLNEGQAVGTGGILNPQPARMAVGHYYYRFASSGSSRASQLGGGWWLDYENFSLIRQFASAHGYPLRDAARLMLALPHAWPTQVDLLVRALLLKPMRAYCGYGKPANGSAEGPDRGTRWIPTQHVRVQQLYVPGLCVAGRSRQLFEEVFARPVEITNLA